MLSHPEKDERPDEPARKTFRCDKALREELLALREQPSWSNNVIAKRVGINTSIVSQYLNEAGCLYDGDVARIEGLFEDMLSNEARRRASGVETVQCDEVEQCRVALEYIRKTSDIGVLLDESGGGKTRGIEHYAKQNTTAIFYRCFAWNISKSSAQNFVFQTVGTTGYDNRTPRAEHAVKKLRGSERLLIVDDAHFLHQTALQWWVHFHEATQCPLALTGTYALIKKIEADPQIFSRVGLRFEIKKTGKDGALAIDRPLLRHLISELAPKVNGELDELLDLCEQVGKEHGHYRSVHKQLKVATELKTGNPKLTYVQAFRAAHTMLVRNYNLS